MSSIFSIGEIYSVLNLPSKDKQLEKVAVEFEAIFLQKILSELSSSTENPFFSPQTRFWEKMYIMQVGEKLAESGGVGFKKYVINAYKKNLR
ncbi:rod-binding protein [Desulfurobacterium crinifex]